MLEVVSTFENTSDQQIPHRIVERRPGDVATNFANPKKAAKELGWHADKDIRAMCKNAWLWQFENSDEYE